MSSDFYIQPSSLIQRSYRNIKVMYGWFEKSCQNRTRTMVKIWTRIITVRQSFMCVHLDNFPDFVLLSWLSNSPFLFAPSPISLHSDVTDRYLHLIVTSGLVDWFDWVDIHVYFIRLCKLQGDLVFQLKANYYHSVRNLCTELILRQNNSQPHCVFCSFAIFYWFI